MILQRDKHNRSEIREEGCNFTCYPALGEIIQGGKWSFGPGELEEFYQLAVSQGWMTRRCFINGAREEDPPWMTGHLKLLILTGVKPKGSFVTGPEYKPREGEFEVVQYLWNGYRHFVVGDGKGGVAFDPWGSFDGKHIFSKVVTYGKPVAKRIIQI
jgi:hypothetical protein